MCTNYTIFYCCLSRYSDTTNKKSIYFREYFALFTVILDNGILVVLKYM